MVLSKRWSSTLRLFSSYFDHVYQFINAFLYKNLELKKFRIKNYKKMLWSQLSVL